MALRLSLGPAALRLAGVRYMAGEFGSGAGKGGGAGGTVREAGGSFGKMEAAHEEIYFKKLEREQFAKLRKHLEEEMEYHKDQIEEHQQSHQIARIREQLDDVVDYHQRRIRELQEAIERHKKKIQKLHHQEKDMTGTRD